MKTKAQIIEWLQGNNTARVILVEIFNVYNNSGTLIPALYLSNRMYGTGTIPAGYTATSSTSSSISTGTKTFTINTAKSFIADEEVEISNGNNKMIGTISSYNSTTGALVVNITSISGSGTFNSWNIQLNIPSNQLYDACISGGVTFNESIDIFTGQPTIGYGDIEIYNADGAKDNWLNYVWANKLVTVWIGDSSWARNDFYPIFKGLIKDLDTKSRTSLNLILVNKLQAINEAITNTTMSTVGGTGTNTDQLVPLCFGECFNITPIVRNSSLLQYQVHSSLIEDVVEVRDGGAIMPFAVSAADGYFTLNSTAFNTVTATVQGSKSLIGETIVEILTNYGKKISTFDIEQTTFSTFDTNKPREIGLYVTNRQNVLELCQNLANSAGCYIVPTISGKLKLVELLVDYVGTPTYSVNQSDMEQRSLNISSKLDVQTTVRLGYSKNWTVQTSGLVQSIKPEAAAIFEKEYYYATKVADATTVSIYNNELLEPEPKNTLLVTQADAELEAEKLLNIRKVPRFVYTANYFSKMLFCEIGDFVNITHPRFGLSSGKSGMVVSVARDWLKGKVSIGVFI